MLIKNLSYDHRKLRENLIERQLRPNKINGVSLLSAFESVPREIFLPPRYYGMAYTEKKIQIAPNRFLLCPLQLAQLLNAADLTPTDKGLVLGFATGYSLAIVTQVIRETLGVECDQFLFETTQDSLNQMGICDLSLENNALENGIISSAPYTVIVIEGAVHTVPDCLLNQLAVGGRLVCFQKAVDKTTGQYFCQGVLITRNKNGYTTKSVFESAVDYLPGFLPPRVFSF